MQKNSRFHIVQTVGDVTECVSAFETASDAISYAFTELGLSGDEVDVLDTLGVVAWTEGDGLLTTVKLLEVPDAEQ